MLEIFFCIMAYGIGSLSSAVVICRCMGLPDPRTTGSKNPGATNVLRVGGKKAAIATLLGDVLKGVLPVFVAIQLNFAPLFISLVMLAVFIGHLYPLFFHFQGGKGVATALGAVAALSWPAGLLLVLTWLLIAFLFHYSSLAALSAALLAPLYVAYFSKLTFLMPVLMMSLLIVVKHRHNIKRLWQGKEPKIGASTVNPK